MSSVHLCLSIFSIFLIAAQYVQGERYKTIYQKILEEPDYSSFSDLVRNNRIARLHLHYEPLTVFVPANEAFDSYDSDTYSDLAFYHMSFDVKTLEQLQSVKALISVNYNNPPIWINEVNGNIYVNNAKILEDKSNYASISRSGPMGQQQVLHMIDRVLDPMIRTPEFCPSALDFLTTTQKWNLGASKTVTKFYQKIQANKLLQVFKAHKPHTFFIPIDSGIDPHKYNMLDEEVVLRHVIPNHVIFSRLTEDNPVIIMTDDDSPYTLSIEQSEVGLFVKGKAKDSVESGFDDFTSEILVADIPLKNGVLHLISQPLGTFKNILRPFPYLPVLTKISNDPELDIFYKLGEMTKFNKILEKENVNFTYFVARDSSWVKTSQLGLVPADNTYNILPRHLLVSQYPYSMKQLAQMTKLNNYTDLELHSEDGALKISVLKIMGYYYVVWNNRYIKVIRPDYLCTHGIVHILNGPLVNFKRQVASGGANYNKFRGVSRSVGQYWVFLKDMMF